MDTGPIILQAVVPVHFDDTKGHLAERILQEGIVSIRRHYN